MLPPESTATAGVSKCVGVSSRAATAAAPAGSTTILARSTRASSARDSDSSETVTISSTWSRTAAKVMSPGRPTAMPSAIVVIDVSGTGSPAAQRARERRGTLGLHPDHAHVGARGLDRDRDAGQQPAAAGRHQHGLTSGACSRISSPSVPWPATTSAWSKGWISTAPVSSANARASTSASSR